MSNYTPTTEEVQRAYRNSEYGCPDNWLELKVAEFDRWLDEVKAQAWEEGCRWGAVEFQTLNGKLYDEDKVQVTDADNPYRQGEEQ